MIVVTNRAQRCETHKLALFLVGGRVKVSRAVSVVAILVKNNTAREFLKELCTWSQHLLRCNRSRLKGEPLQKLLYILGVDDVDHPRVFCCVGG